MRVAAPNLPRFWSGCKRVVRNPSRLVVEITPHTRRGVQPICTRSAGCIPVGIRWSLGKGGFDNDKDGTLGYRVGRGLSTPRLGAKSIFNKTATSNTSNVAKAMQCLLPLLERHLNGRLSKGPMDARVTKRWVSQLIRARLERAYAPGQGLQHRVTTARLSSQNGGAPRRWSRESQQPGRERHLGE